MLFFFVVNDSHFKRLFHIFLDRRKDFKNLDQIGMWIFPLLIE